MTDHTSLPQNPAPSAQEVEALIEWLRIDAATKRACSDVYPEASDGFRDDAEKVDLAATTLRAQQSTIEQKDARIAELGKVIGEFRAELLKSVARAVKAEARIQELEGALGNLEAANDVMAAAITSDLYNAMTDAVPGIDVLRSHLDASRRIARAVLSQEPRA